MSNAFDIAFNQTQREQSLTKLSSTGKIPEWINGTFYRNGPGLFSVPDKSLEHWFDGLAMVHRFDIKNGSVSYMSKYLDTDTKTATIDEGKISYPQFATDPCVSIFKKLKLTYEILDPKVAFTHVNDRLFALGETKLQLEIDKKTLESIGVYNCIKDDFKYTPTKSTAHPHVEGKYLYNVVLKMGPFNYYDIIKYDIESQQTTSICKIPIAKPSYIHSMGMSENYFILAHFPYECTSIEFLLKNKPFIKNFKWYPKRKSRIWIVSKKTGKIIHKCKVDPFFAFHFVNAYEKDKQLIFDLCSYPNADVVNSFYLNRLGNSEEEFTASTITRFTFDFGDQSLSHSTLSDTPMELATIDDRAIRKEYNYIYGLSIAEDGSRQFYDQLVKLNINTGENMIWRDPDYYPGEPKFIPSGYNLDDDDGIVVSILINIKDKTKGSKLLFLDAKTFKEVASCHTPHSIVPGFHNYYI